MTKESASAPAHNYMHTVLSRVGLCVEELKHEIIYIYIYFYENRMDMNNGLCTQLSARLINQEYSPWSVN